MTSVVLISLICLLVQLLVLIAMRTARLFVWVHAAFFVMFVPFLHLVQYLAGDIQDVKAYELDLYLLAHFTVVGYLLGFMPLATVLTRFMPSDVTVSKSILRVSNVVLTGIFSAWLVQKSYIAMKYGPLGLASLRVIVQGADEFRLDFFDTVISVYLTHFAIGASVVFVLKAVITRRLPTIVPSGVFVMFLSTYLVLGESNQGARRFILLLALLAITAAARAWQMEPRRLVTELSKIGVVAVAVAVGFSGYFQVVRNNVQQPEIAVLIVSASMQDIAKGVLLALVPSMDDGEEREGPDMLREGAFELVYDVLEKEVKTGATTRGHITAASLEMVIPHAIAGPEKASFSTDLTMVDELGIVPSGGFDLGVDLAASLLAVFLADYGPAGVLIAPMVTVLSLLAASLILIREKTSTLLKVLALSVLFQIAGNVEGDLITVLALIRELFAGCIAIAAVLAVTRVVGTILRREPVRLQLTSKA